MCGNYAVRFVCIPDQVKVTNHWTTRVLTIANPDANQVVWAKGQPFNSSWGQYTQTWHIEGVNDGVNFNYVRFHNQTSGIYLNADDSLKVSLASLRNSWLSEQWVIEYVPGSPYVRFRNLWKTDMYLTMVENSDYSPVNLQPLHKNASGQPDWTSQEWTLDSTP